MTGTRVEENLRESFRIMARANERGDLREMDGVTIASSGVAFQMFNAAFLSKEVDSEPDLALRIAMAQSHFRTKGLEWACWLSETWLGDKMKRRAHRVCQEHNLTLAIDLPGMEAEAMLPPCRPLPAIEVRRVCDTPTKLAFCEIGAGCFHVPLLWFREVFERETLWNHFRGYVGYVDGEAVCTAATVVAAGAVGVYNVATRPGRQRRGYGEAVMRHAIGRARSESGISRTILQATQQGLRLYERMGYKTVTRIVVYSS